MVANDAKTVAKLATNWVAKNDANLAVPPKFRLLIELPLQQLIPPAGDGFKIELWHLVFHLHDATLKSDTSSREFPRFAMNREEEVAGAENLASRLQSSIEEAQRNYDQGDVSSYMFSQPIQQAQCYVEVQVTHRHPGRCIRLGGQIPACRSNEYLHVNYQECS
ncbi:UNVERIFIED_CONTAM: hypothetical protein NCL1_09900 [Trichonephila clavipes]